MRIQQVGHNNSFEMINNNNYIVLGSAYYFESVLLLGHSLEFNDEYQRTTVHRGLINQNVRF